jgi:hypothetical protein
VTHLLERISDENASAARVGRTEFEVVVDDVVTRLGPDEEAAPQIELETAAEIRIEMVDRLIIRAVIDAARGASIVARAQRSDACDEFEVSMRGNFG